MSDLFHHDNNSIKQEVLEHITSVDGRGVFLVLEGYDEPTILENRVHNNSY